MTSLDVVIMAAGKGTRMRSQRPKVLHRLAGRALVQHVVDTAARLLPRRVVVVTGFGADAVQAHLAEAAAAQGRPPPQFVHQAPQLGTGHAVMQAAPLLGDDGIALILNGDVPLIEAATLRDLVSACGGERLALLTVDLPDPSGYGRIVRDGPQVRAIVEHRDASAEQRAIREVYTGAMAAPAARLKAWLARIGNQNDQGEYYLTDVVGLAVADGVPVVAHRAAERWQVEGVNSPLHLAELERAHQLRQARVLLERGVRLADPARIDVRGELLCGQDVEIDVNCVFEGRVELGDGVRVGAHCVLANVRIGPGAVIHPFCHIDGESAGAAVGEAACVGPFARLRPGARLGDEVHVGNFVEVKNSTLARGAKANHLAYLGDADVGERVNFGAGSITANYDGANKHRTVIGDDVHVGSNSVLVAPVALGAGGTVGAGSVITRDTEPGALTVTRAKAVSVRNWQRPVKKKGG